jgi:hypothetical protein|tara:strand:+ start:254 stop:568 length:315 start_codon:yes stop_codon:yes gene_type:complete
MKNTELLHKLVEAFHNEIDWETKENIESGMYNCLPIIEEHCKDFIKNCDLPIVINRFLAIHDYPNMEHEVNDVIELPSEEWKHADGSYCDAQYFLDFPDYFKKI